MWLMILKNGSTNILFPYKAPRNFDYISVMMKQWVSKKGALLEISTRRDARDDGRRRDAGSSTYASIRAFQPIYYK